MGWICKICTFVAPETNAPLRHYRLRHNDSIFLPCLYADCPCSFKTWNTLKSHLSRKQSTNTSTPEVMSFNCELCSSCFSTEKDYFQHLGVHLRKNQTVHCVFKECDFYTNVYGTFASHRSRKHTTYSSSDFRPQIVHKYVAQTNITDIAEAHCSEAYECSGTYDCIGEYETEELKGTQWLNQTVPLQVDWQSWQPAACTTEFCQPEEHRWKRSWKLEHLAFAPSYHWFQSAREWTSMASYNGSERYCGASGFSVPHRWHN